MKSLIVTAIAIVTALAACGAPHRSTAHGIQIAHASVYVDDLDRALAFYTTVLGFHTKDDVSNGGYRWLTVAAAPEGAELQLVLAQDPAAKALQNSQRDGHQPAAMFYTDDIARDVAAIRARGGTVAMPPTDVTMSTIAMIDDTVGNLVQLTQLKR